MSKWITFQLAEKQNPKTKVYWVITKEQPYLTLGQIKWFGRWRKYSFFPQPETVFERDCLNDIISFIGDLERRRVLDKEREKAHDQQHQQVGV